MNSSQFEKIKSAKGFIAALDQSGGSTPKTLTNYGVNSKNWQSDEEMFDLIHTMRSRIVTSPAFSGNRVIGAILFEETMRRKIIDKKAARYLWEEKEIVPFIKVDRGLEEIKDDAQILKPIPNLDSLLDEAIEQGVFGTKMRSVIYKANLKSIKTVVAQQFEIGTHILSKGLVPIIEPEVNIDAKDKAECETILRDVLLTHLDMLDSQVMLKLTLPEEPNFYQPLIAHPNILRVVALSGGYSQSESCKRLTQNENMIASFSRALTQDLRAQQNDTEFNAALDAALEKIYQASLT